MLLDMDRLERVIDRRFPPGDGPAADAPDREGARRLRARAADPLDGDRPQRRDRDVAPRATGLVPGAEQYALLFGVWTAVIEVIPYIGPWLSAVPPAIYALVVDPVSVLWVIGALRLHLPGRGPHRRAQRDGERAPAASAPRHLRPARGRRALRDRRASCSRCRRWRPRGRSGSSSRARPVRPLGRRRGHPGRPRAWKGRADSPADVPLPR